MTGVDTIPVVIIGVKDVAVSESVPTMGRVDGLKRHMSIVAPKATGIVRPLMLGDVSFPNALKKRPTSLAAPKVTGIVRPLMVLGDMPFPTASVYERAFI